jgi:hypothetical protein
MLYNSCSELESTAEVGVLSHIMHIVFEGPAASTSTATAVLATNHSSLLATIIPIQGFYALCQFTWFNVSF